MSTAITISQGPCDVANTPPPPGAGGQAIFVGRTRAETHPEHGSLAALDYDMHEPLVVSVLHDLAQEAIDQGALAVTIAHAKGAIPVGEASVCIEVHAGHRSEAFAACRMLIDALKARAPICKREMWAHGTTWKDGTPPPMAST